MSDHTPNTQDTPPEVSQGDSIDHSRRKLTGAALGVSAIFTLASRPVLAQQCMTASSVASGNLSSPGTLVPCVGLTPAQWVALAQVTNPENPNDPDNNGFPGGNVRFHTVFKSGIEENWGPDTRLYQVMLLTASFMGTTIQTNPITKEFAAALLNIRGKHIPDTILSENDLIGMWNEWMDKGVYAPRAGATWDTAQIVVYLQSLQGV